MPEVNDKPKLVHEQALAILQGSAKQVLDLFHEPDAVMVTVLWDPKLGDLPGSFVSTKDQGVVDPFTFIRCVAQMSKMSVRLLSQVSSQLQQMEAVITSRLKELERLAHEAEDLREAAVRGREDARPAVGGAEGSGG